MMLLIAAAVALAACGNDEATEEPTPEAKGPVRNELDLPEVPPTEEERIAFYLLLLRRGGRDEVLWAGRQLELVGPAAAGPLGKQLEAALTKNAILAESILSVFAKKVPGGAALEAIGAATKSRDGRVRVLATRALGETGAPEAVAPLLDLACDANERVALSAVGSLDRIGSENAVRGLLGRFGDRLHPGARAPAVAVIGSHLPDEEAVAFLVGLLESDDVGAALVAARSLARRGDERGRDELWGRLPKLDGPLHWAAIEALAEARDARIVPLLLEEARSGVRERQIAAAAFLGHFESEEVRKALWGLAAAVDPGVRQEAFLALHRSGDPEALREVRKLLRRSEDADRLLAADLLAQFRDPVTVPDLVTTAALEENPKIRLALAGALARIGRTEGAPAVLRVLLSETADSPAVSFTAFHVATFLAAFETLPEEVIAGLLETTESESAPLRLAAAKVLAVKEGGARTRAALTRLLTDSSPDVRREVPHLWLALEEADPGPLRDAYPREPLADVAAEMASAARRIVHRWR
ncbi:MAG: HEAT repeat domain-containing protein [Planctomycetota bacterium]|jgi:HEAT repeat protein